MRGGKWGGGGGGGGLLPYPLIFEGGLISYILRKGDCIRGAFICSPNSPYNVNIPCNVINNPSSREEMNRTKKDICKNVKIYGKKNSI